MTPQEISLEIQKAPMSLEEKLKWHFTLFEKQIPEAMLPVCIEAINIANAKGDLSTLLELPFGSTFYGSSWSSAADIIDGHHLGYYVVEVAA